MDPRAVRSIRRLLTAILLSGFAFAATLAARQTQPPRARFSSAVDIVSVDVNVIDRNGRPVRDLQAGDFTLTVDGRVRKIVSAQFVSVTAPPSTASAAADAPAVDYSTNVGAASGRLIAMVVDRGSIAPVRAKDVFAAAARFVGRLQPADRVALYSVPSGTAVDFTTDRVAVMSALQRMDGLADSAPRTKTIGIAEALQFERGNSVTIEDVVSRECGNMAPAGQGSTSGGRGDLMICQRVVNEEASIVAGYAHERARNTLAGLYGILERFGASETPKTIVLVSEGLVIDGDRFATANLARAVAAAHATIYVLKPEPSDSDASQQRAPQERSRDRAVLEEGLSAVTRIGGGDLFRIIADPDFAFDRVASELSGYYLLGFEPDAGDRDGKQHAIHVQVGRSDLSVRSRLEFSVGGERRTDQQVVADMLRSPAVISELPFRLTTYAFQDPESPKVRLLVAMEVDRAPDPNGKMAMGMVLVKPGGEVGATFFQPAISAPVDPAKPQRSFATLLVDPGQYILKAAVIDSAGHRGSLERPVRAFMTRISRFRATELLIGDDKEEKASDGNVVPTVSGNLSGDQLHVYLELFADAPTAFDGASVTIEVSPAGESGVVQTAPAALQPVGSSEKDQVCRAAAGAVPLASLPRGSYVARAVVSLDGRKVGQMTRPFRLVRP